MFKSRLALTAVVALAGFAAAPAHAVLTTFANFTGLDANSGIRFQNSAVDNVSGTSGSLYTINPVSNAPGVRDVSFSFLIPGLSTQVNNVNAAFTLFASTASPAQTFGAFTLQSGLTGGFQFLTTSAITVGSRVYAAGSNLLSGTFNDVSISGQTNATAASYNGSTSAGATITYTSDFVRFAPASDYDLSISLTSLSPMLFANPGSALRSFEAYSTGSFSSDPAPLLGGVPEPSVWAMLVIGFGLVGFQVRRRKANGMAVTA